MSVRILIIPCILLLTEACSNTITPPGRSFSYSFEDGMEGWNIAAADTGNPTVDWSIQPSAVQAYEGQHSLRFYVDNRNDASKIWIIHSYSVTPGTIYHVDVSYYFGTADFGEVNLFELLTGISGTAPADGKSFLSDTRHEDTGNGTPGHTGYLWLHKSFSKTITGNTNRRIYVIIGIWGTYEAPRTYYVDDLKVLITS